MTNSLSILLKKYSVPALFFIVGLLLLVIGIMKKQDGMFMMASVLLFIAGGLSIVFSAGNFNSKLLYTFGIAAGVAGGVTIVASYTSVNETLTYENNYKACKSLSKQNLEDVRYIQKAYAAKAGKYLADWDALEDFAKNGTVPFVEAQGIVPNRKIDTDENKFLYTGNPPIDNNMTEDEAYKLSKWVDGPNYQADFSNFKRDTIQVSLMKYKFGGKSYKSSRKKSGFGPFNSDSLRHIPFTGGRQTWKLEVLDSVKIGDNHLPTIKVSGEIPFANIKGKNGDKEKMHFGSLTISDTEGSWESE
ncbi:MAG: hypothetical protein P8N52_03070 [Crocinitomicaceae bacterium]|nr:hypothetical protein [Crocinitomicaceae bacterium]MDG1777426.1 hypothetical protein [Crocinitomicaceae bacterium]